MRVCALAVPFVLGALAVPAARGDEERFVFEATSGGRGADVSFDVRIDGAEAEVRLRPGGAPGTADRMTLAADEAGAFRGLVGEARLLDDAAWPAPGEARPPRPHARWWSVRLRSGDEVREREFSEPMPAFDRTAAWLDRLARQFAVVRRVADAADAPAAASAAASAAEALDARLPHRDVLRPSKLRDDLVPVLRLALRRPTEGWTAETVLATLARCEPPETWAADAEDEWRRRDPAARPHFARCAARAAAVLDDEDARALVPLTVAEIRASWRTFATGTDARNGLRDLIGFIERVRDERAIGLVEAVAAEAEDGEDDAPAELAGLLVRVGEPAYPAVRRLLESERQAARSMGSRAAASLFRAALRPSRDDPRSDADRAAAIVRLRAELLPAIEAVAARADEAVPSRGRCREVLETLGLRESGSDRAARHGEERARREAEREAQRPPAPPSPADPPPPPRGDLVLSGRVVDEERRPVAGMLVTALREDGPPHGPWRPHGAALTGADGAFRIEGLTPGACALFVTRGDRAIGRTEAALATRADGVAAGATDVVVVHELGGTIRGRLLLPDGSPAGHRDVSVRRRGEPPTPLPMRRDVLGWDTTADDGSFWFVRLVPGTYDVEVAGPGFATLDGASGIETGARDVVVRMVRGAAVRGRVVDETGAPLAGASVHAWPEDDRARTVSAGVGGDGAFELRDLLPDRRYVVAAGIRGSPLTERSPGAEVRDVVPGASGLVLRVDTAPRLAGRVEPGVHDFALFPPLVRCVHVATGRELVSDTPRFDWRAVPPGRWRVLAHRRRLDAAGKPVEDWVELGEVGSGDANVLLALPR